MLTTANTIAFVELLMLEAQINTLKTNCRLGIRLPKEHPKSPYSKTACLLFHNEDMRYFHTK